MDRAYCHLLSAACAQHSPSSKPRSGGGGGGGFEKTFFFAVCRAALLGFSPPFPGGQCVGPQSQTLSSYLAERGFTVLDWLLLCNNTDELKAEGDLIYCRVAAEKKSSSLLNDSQVNKTKSTSSERVWN